MGSSTSTAARWRSAAVAVPLRLRRSWRPMSAPREARPEAGAGALRLFLREHALRHSLDRAGEVRPGLGDHCRHALVDRERNGAIRGDLVAHLLLESGLDLALLHPDLAVRAVQDDAYPRLRERQHLERRQGETDVLQRRHVERADEEQLVGP